VGTIIMSRPIISTSNRTRPLPGPHFWVDLPHGLAQRTQTEKIYTYMDTDGFTISRCVAAKAQRVSDELIRGTSRLRVNS